jgi:hypothetical protein
MNFVCILCDGRGHLLHCMQCKKCAGRGVVDESEWILHAEEMWKWIGPVAREQALSWGTAAILSGGTVIRVRTPSEHHRMVARIGDAFCNVADVMDRHFVGGAAPLSFTPG